MSDEKALLSAIWEHPHEDTPRLVYADWLDEHEQPERAEFIRVQIELARLGEWDDSPRKAELERREKQLWAKHAKTWKTGLSPFLQKRAGFHRGFPAPPLREMPSSKFVKLTADDFAGAPLWSFHFPGNTRLILILLACPHLLRIGTLDLSYWLELPAQWRRFATSPHVRNIAELNVGGSRSGDEGVAELAANAGGLPHLWRLDLEGNDLTPHGIEALVASPLADGLRDLHLFMNALGSAGVQVLAGAPRLGRLERLNIVRCEGDVHRPITREAVVALFASPHLRALKDLTLDPTRFDAADVEALCATRPVFCLRALRLYSILTKIGDGGAEALAAWPALEDVRVLHLHSNSIGAVGARALARSPYLNKVTELRLDLNPLRSDAVAVKALRDRFGAAVQVD
jgi:uncharacterized protein (TIGR02996 family)